MVSIILLLSNKIVLCGKINKKKNATEDKNTWVTYL